MKWLWFISGTLTGLVILSIALGSVPVRGRITDDTAIYQNLSDIRVAREAELNFDGDIARLSAAEADYKEKLPSLAQHPRIKGPVQRVSQQKYRFAR